jgi:hypothetical protein
MAFLTRSSIFSSQDGSRQRLLPAGEDGWRDQVHFFELRLDRLPKLPFDNREIIGARLASPECAVSK